MVSIHGYSPERKEKSSLDIYMKVILFGIVAACIFIVGGIGFRFLIQTMIEYWAWALGVVMGLILFKKLYIDRNKGYQNAPHRVEYPNYN